MELTFLGTSSGTPTRDRNVTAVALRRGSSWDLFDCGEGTQHRLLSTSLSLTRLRRIFISHLHGDHCFGLFGLLGSRSMSGGSRPLDIYGPEGLEEMVTTVLRHSDTHLGYPVTFHVVPEDGRRVVESTEETIDGVALDHRVTSFGWCIRERDRPGVFDPDRAAALGVDPGPAFGQLQRGESVTTVDGSTVHPDSVVGPPRAGRSLIISGDNRDPARLLTTTGPVQLLVHEATFTEPVLERLGDDRGHSTAARVGRAAQNAALSHLILTHFSPRYGPPGCSGQSVDEIRTEAAEQFDGNLHLAQDYARYELDHHGAVTVTQP